MLTALKASFTGMFGLHEATQTLKVMKEGVSKSLEVLAEIGDQVGEAAVKAGYGPTIRADAVKKLVDSVVTFQERSLEIVDEMRKLSTQNSAEIRDAVEDGKRRIARLVAEGKALPRRWLTPRAAHAGAALRAGAPRAAPPRNLDELMLAMDVVDTLRHQENLVARELDEERARGRAPGAPAPDLPAARASRCPTASCWRACRRSRRAASSTRRPRPGFARTLARALGQPRPDRHGGSSRSWPLLGIGWGAYHFGVVRAGASSGRRAAGARPSAARIDARRAAVPAALEQGAARTCCDEAKVPAARERADRILADGRAALDRRDAAGARQAIADLETLRADLRREYVLRIVSRPSEPSGVWRVPGAQPATPATTT